MNFDATTTNVDLRPATVPRKGSSTTTSYKIAPWFLTSLRENWEWKKWYSRLPVLQNLLHGWDGRDAPKPADTAIMNGYAVLQALESAPRTAPLDRIIPDAAGGIAFYFFGVQRTGDGSPVRYASIDCANDGTAAVVLAETGCAPRVRQFEPTPDDLSQVIPEIVTFLRS